jgi:hypothetical protein
MPLDASTSTLPDARFGPARGASWRRRSLHHLFLFASSTTSLCLSLPRSLHYCDHTGFYPVWHYSAFQLLVAFFVLGFVSSVCYIFARLRVCTGGCVMENRILGNPLEIYPNLAPKTIARVVRLGCHMFVSQY